MAMNAPMSGFPATQKKWKDTQNEQGGPGLPPPPVPGTPAVPRTALTAANQFGLASQGGGLIGTGDKGINAVPKPNLTPGSALDSYSAPSGAAPDTAPFFPGAGMPAWRDSQGPMPADPLVGTGYGANVAPKSAMDKANAAGVATPTGAPVQQQAKPSMDSFVTSLGTAPGLDYAGWLQQVQSGRGGNDVPQPAQTAAPVAATVDSGAAQTPTDINFTEWMKAHAAPPAADVTKSTPAETSAAATDQPAAETTQETTPTTAPDTTQTGPTSPSLNPNDYTAATTPYDQSISDWNTVFQDWLKNNMANASPYSTALIKQGQQVLEDAINRQAAAGQQQLEEYMASRGLTGSSLEATAMKDYQAQMQEQYRAGMFELGQAQVDAYLKHESTVGSLAAQYMSGLTDQQRNALSSVQNQMSLAMQKYGIDKSSADAAAGREVQREIAVMGFLADRGYDATPEDWDTFASVFGEDRAKLELGPRPDGGTTSGASGDGGSTDGQPQTDGSTPTTPSAEPKAQMQGITPETPFDHDWSYLSTIGRKDGKVFKANPPFSPKAAEKAYHDFEYKWGIGSASSLGHL